MDWGPFPESGPSSSYNFSPTSPASQPPLLFRPRAPDQDAFQTILDLCVFLVRKQPSASPPLYVRSVLSSWAQSVKRNYFQNLSTFHHHTAGTPPPHTQFQAQKWVEGTEEGRRGGDGATCPCCASPFSSFISGPPPPSPSLPTAPGS
ncbi:unnamed protein product [Rangifer tarandus platyrhynchus]|uniref:Uncharacterized protein n=1 Tax=Rangifer tarandus platyrhynchus TaxID=3082113 RepID=A0ABN9A3Q4_RANTA|nr:unnamed protein product [Rangifer tarandus platyrhynchus]